MAITQIWGKVMTIIRDMSDSPSEFAKVFKGICTQPRPFAHVFEVFWQLAREEHAGWSFDERHNWAKEMAGQLAREHDLPNHA